MLSFSYGFMGIILSINSSTEVIKSFSGYIIENEVLNSFQNYCVLFLEIVITLQLFLQY